VGGKIMSYDKEYTFTVVAPTHLNAVYNRDYNGMMYSVTFLTDSDQELLRKNVSVNASVNKIEVPTVNPQKYGYAFLGWAFEGSSDIIEESALKQTILDALQNGNVVLVPVYAQSTDTFTVTVTNGSGAGSYYASSIVTVTADEAEDGKQFAYWVVVDNGEETIVSYTESYTFALVKDIEVKAVFVDDGTSVEERAVVTVTNYYYDSSANTATFVSERYIPEEYTLLQAGVILTSDAYLAAEDDEFILGATGILTGRTSMLDNIGTYTVIKSNANAAEVWYARAYAVYSGTSGDLVYIYSSVESVSTAG